MLTWLKKSTTAREPQSPVRIGQLTVHGDPFLGVFTLGQLDGRAQVTGSLCVSMRLLSDEPELPSDALRDSRDEGNSRRG
jgi:hypothetical protein